MSVISSRSYYLFFSLHIDIAQIFTVHQCVLLVYPLVLMFAKTSGLFGLLLLLHGCTAATDFSWIREGQYFPNDVTDYLGIFPCCFTHWRRTLTHSHLHTYTRTQTRAHTTHTKHTHTCARRPRHTRSDLRTHPHAACVLQVSTWSHCAPTSCNRSPAPRMTLCHQRWPSDHRRRP